MRCSASFALSAVFVTALLSSPAASVDFQREVRPILEQRCTECHGEKKQKAGVRLDRKTFAFAPTDSGKPVIEPRHSAQSPLWLRVTSTNADEIMPPKGEPLTAAQTKLIQRWIDEGAAWPDDGAAVRKKHWAYEKPVRPAVPKASKTVISKSVINGAGKAPRTDSPITDLLITSSNPIDAFILERLQQEKLKPAPEADRATLLRRVSLDLTGLPPAVAEVDAFLADKSKDAYEKAVDRLLASPHFGERWARPWLDMARYADTQGYEKDNRRTMWPWRDWVVSALNQNKPFDQFTIEQIAGDLLPDATQEQKVATGFHRNTMTNTEGGTDDEEFRHEAVVDRVNTTFSTWMATTMACAQCHNHKYDPLAMKEYYQAYAFLNQTADSDKDDERPVLKVFKAGEKEALAAKREALKEAEARWKKAASAPELTNAFLAWQEKTLAELTNAPSTNSTAKVKKDAKPAGEELRKLLTIAPEKRDKDQRAKLKELFESSALELKEPREALTAARVAEKKFNDAIPTSMVFEELAKPRDTFMLVRGSFLTKGERVSPGVPAVLNPLPPGAATNRLAFARWLVDTNNPLTARVMVNRFWEQIFGVGIVETSEDFGAQGEPPSHPKLLDWLAVEFMQSGGAVQGLAAWDTKRLLRLIVTSATYRQSSKVTPELLQRDPYNRLLARGARRRLDAEMVRDQSLAVSGLLSRKLGGAPVMPPQPDGVWQVVYSGDKWETSAGEDKYRRGLYTFWRRTSPYPSMVSFDAPSGEFCVVRRTRSNTPLQALTLLNDPVYLECAQALAKRMLSEGGATAEQRAGFGLRACLAREPKKGEAKQLAALAEKQLARYREDSESAAKFLKFTGADAKEKADAAELAAWTVVANVLLNLDEFVMKQ
jgi:Protein of unknown function (DUF1553)/Protein of unknown function (DUF1549)/Planctomycete cytochrome C